MHLKIFEFSTKIFRLLYFLHKPCSFHPLSNGGNLRPLERLPHILNVSLYPTIPLNTSIENLHKFRQYGDSPFAFILTKRARYTFKVWCPSVLYLAVASEAVLAV